MRFSDKNGLPILGRTRTGRPRADGRVLLDDLDLEDSILDGARASDIVFELGSLEGASCKSAVINNCRFVGTLLGDTNLEFATLTDVEFYDVQAYEALFHHSELIRVSFFGANLSFANFGYSLFDSVRFAADNVGMATDLRGANLSNVDLSSTRFEQATYDEKTVFPPDFRPELHKALMRSD